MRHALRISIFGSVRGQSESEREAARAGEHIGGDAKTLGMIDDIVEQQEGAFLLGHQFGEATDLEIPVGAVDVFDFADARGGVDEGS